MIPSLVEDLPKLGDWTIVCSRLYTPMERRRLVYGGNVLTRINPRTIQTTFLNKIMAGQIFQSVNDWEDLQRRLRASGYSDDLSLLQEKMAMANTLQQYVDQIQEPTETTTTTANTATTATTTTLPTTPSTGRKRTIADCHENDNHQDNLDQNTLPDPENRNKKMKQTLRERMAMRAGHLWLRDETFLAAKIQQLKEYTLAFDEARRNPSPEAFAQMKTPKFWDPAHVAAAAAAAGATIIPQDNETRQETNQLSPLAAAAAGLDPLVDRNVMERAIHSALTNYHATSRNINRTLDWPSMDWSNRKNAPPPSKAVATNPIALATSTFKTTTSTTTMAPSPPSLVDTRKSVPAASLPKESLDPLPMHLTPPRNNPIMAPDREKNLDMVGDTTTTSTTSTGTTIDYMALEEIDDQLPECQEIPVVNNSENRPITDSPRNAQEVVVNQPMEMAHDSTTVAVPTDPKEASLPVMDDGSLHNQDQPEAESTSMTIPVQEDDETAVMLPHVPKPYQGQFRFIMIRMAVWSIFLHALLWTWLEATDDRLDNNPLRICLSMETLGRPTRSHYSSLATMDDTNPHYGPWLGNSEDDDATSLPGMSSLAKTASGMYLNRVCTPWYGVMNLTLGVVLVSIWMVSRHSFKK